MPKTQTEEQKDIMEDVMHDFKEGDLKTSAGDIVKSRQQAIAIGLSESGSSNQQSKSENKKRLKRTRQKKKE